MLMPRSRYLAHCVDQTEAGKKVFAAAQNRVCIAYVVGMCYTSPGRFNEPALSTTPVCVPPLSPKRLCIAEHQNELIH